MNFNELYVWLDRFQLMDPQFKSHDAARLFTTITGSDEIVAQVHRNNADSEMILDEFIEFLFSLGIEKKLKRERSLNRQDDGKKFEPADAVRIFLEKTVLPQAAREMPIAGSALINAVGKQKDDSEGYDAIDCEEEVAICITIDEFCIQIDGFCIQNDDLKYKRQGTYGGRDGAPSGAQIELCEHALSPTE